MDDFIMEIPGAATPEFCRMMIDKYEDDTRKKAGQIGPEGKIDRDVRDSINLEMKMWPEWEGVVKDLRGMIFSRMTKYLDEIHTAKTKSMYQGGYDSSYSLLKYDTDSKGYDWHNDFMWDDFTNRNGVRTITWLFYLNDDFEGGETEFHWGTKIKPETGKLVFFPSCWTFVHRGRPVTKGEKYLAVGWLYSTWNQPIKQT